MSKIYEAYKMLKEQDPKKMYLFRSGNFYIFIGEDVSRINEYIVLKRTKFTNEIDKCGFPCNSYQDYMRVFHNQHLPIEVIENYKEIFNDIEDMILSLDLTAMTPIDCLNKLYEYQNYLKNNPK